MKLNQKATEFVCHLALPPGPPKQVSAWGRPLSCSPVASPTHPMGSRAFSLLPTSLHCQPANKCLLRLGYVPGSFGDKRAQGTDTPSQRFSSDGRMDIIHITAPTTAWHAVTQARWELCLTARSGRARQGE